MSWYHRRLHPDDRVLIQNVWVALATMQSKLMKLENEIMAIRPEIQAVLDAVSSLQAPLAALEAAQSAELAQIADLTAKVAAGGQLTDEEKTALTGAVSTLQTTVAGVVAATPAPAVVTAAG